MIQRQTGKAAFHKQERGGKESRNVGILDTQIAQFLTFLTKLSVLLAILSEQKPGVCRFA